MVDNNNKQQRNTMINTDKESRDYFSHNPKAKVVGFALLTAEQMNEHMMNQEITIGELDVLEVVVNPDVKDVIAAEYKVQ